MAREKQTVYLNGEYIDREEASISPEDRGFLFADGVYEVVISYGGRIFRIEDHVARLRRSLGGISIRGIDASILADIAPELLARNDLSEVDAIIYMQVTRGAAPRLHAFPAEGTPPTVYAFARRFQLPIGMIRDGTRIITVPDIRWTRCDIKSVSLLPNVLAKQKAEEEGAGEAVFVRDGALTEGTASNFAAVFGGTLVTHHDCGFILSGITKKAVFEICADLGIPVEQRPVKTGELAYADEMMILSTTKEIVPVVRIDDRVVGDGRPGPVTLRLQKEFGKIKRL
ncbi:MAG: aminotransferase class IV [Candidatus Krumholzibacteria bacterium]|jgi:D-alanine transaminase|nr:aminotransferase class IV [Candidatus Krumholzibacteria bacterium]